VFKSGIFLIAVILLAGCAANSVHRLPSSEAAGNTNEVLAFPTPPPPRPAPSQTFPSNPAPENLTPTPSAAPPPLTTWTSLESWTKGHHVDSPKRLNDLPVAAYSIATKNGTMVLEIGSREVSWNGMQISLGFAPQLIDGEVSLYGLDLQKNLEPLLCEPPLELATNGVIVIDPGHGGSNVGTHSVIDGRFEKEFTLDLAERLKPLLEAEGWKVFLTRASDMFVTNSDRVVFADAHHADLFISLHFN
jgi:N-acetylmuramoyl-L-alanine amidase